MSQTTSAKPVTRVTHVHFEHTKGIAVPRTFEVQVFYKGRYEFEVEQEASDHRNAVMLVVNKHKLTHAYECTVNEVIRLPKSTYVIFNHISTQIEQKC